VIEGKVICAPAEFKPITVQFILNTEKDLDRFVCEFGHTTLCNDVYMKLESIQKEHE
jgi:hypothetical protein